MQSCGHEVTHDHFAFTYIKGRHESLLIGGSQVQQMIVQLYFNRITPPFNVDKLLFDAYMSFFVLAGGADLSSYSSIMFMLK